MPKLFDLIGFNITSPPNRLVGHVASASNVRAYIGGGFTLRNVLTNAILTVTGTVNSLARLNDTTSAGPVAGYTYIIGAGTSIFQGVSGTLTAIGTGYSGNPLSLVPFRPNASVQPWMYIGDKPISPTGSITYVTITTKFAIDGTTTTFNCSGMTKMRSDGLLYKMGIAEPQYAPDVATTGTTTTGTDALPATTIPWTNVGGANPSYNYGHTSGGDGTAPVVISTPVGSQTLTLVVTGTATVNGAVHAPGDTGPTGSTYPANFTGAGPTIVVGAFTDGSGNVLTGTSPVPLLANVGAGITLTVPSGAAQFQVGIDSSANTFSANSGSYTVNWTLVTSAIATKVSTLGNVTVYYWGDSPHTGPVSVYIWKNPNDTGTGIPRSIGDAAGTVTNNSWQFDSSPENGTVPMQWDTLDSSGTITGTIPVFTPALESEGYQDFNMCVVGSIFVPAAGTYAFTFVNKDQIMVGIGGGVTTSSSQTTGSNGQTISVVNSLPLVYVSTPSGGGGAVTQTIDITFSGTGTYQVEIDYDYWDKAGRQLYMTCNGAVIPPLPQGVRTDVSYVYVYRDSLTGAISNPSPASPQQLTPVLDNTVTPLYSPDPQVDKVDFYRQDSGLANYTYVATGPNTNPPTSITDTLSDLDAANNNEVEFDNFEPFPSIDIPKSGVVNVSGGVVTWVSGDQFNIRWLGGTIIEIGSPTQIAYSAVRRPASATSWDFNGTSPDIPDGTNLVYNIAEPILAAQPLAYLFGPTDNINFTFGVGDPLRPGTLYWCKGSNLDSAPDTNQLDVTDPSEALVNGDISGGFGVLFSIKRAWIIAPNFFNSEATAEGTVGSTWTLQETDINRGLYIPNCVSVEGGGKIFFRVSDGIAISIKGSTPRSITDDDLYVLFPHESPGVVSSAPQPVTRQGITYYPPDDTQPERQQFSVSDQYLYYDYVGTDGNPHTLVFDINNMGWVWDTLTPPATIHAPNQGLTVQGVLVGCEDGTVRQMSTIGSESVTGTVITSAIGGTGWQHIHEYAVEYSSNSTITLNSYAIDEGNGSYGPASITLPSTGGQITKLRGLFSPNKWKLLWFEFVTNDPTAKVFSQGFVCTAKSWGIDETYRTVLPFAPNEGGEGPQ